MIDPALPTAGGLLLGAVAGSYLATALVRWPQGRSTRRGRSRCDACGVALSPAALVPVASYVLQRGRCRACGAPIGRDHLGMELACAVIGAAAGALHGHSPALALATAVAGWLLLLLAVLDWRYYWLPDRLTLPLGLAGLVANLCGLGPGPVAALTGAAAGYLALAAVALAYRFLRVREGLGAGDPKLFGAIGAWVGWQMLPWVLLGAALAGLLLALAPRFRAAGAGAATRLPLGTLLALAAWPIWIAVQPA